VDFEDHRAYYCSLQAVPVLINQFLQSIENVAKCNLILRSLLVADIARREEQIHEAYDKTFDWIFDGDNDEEIHEDHDNVDAARNRFEQWLRTSSEVFLINCKAGSGNSTLMKYLSSHAKTGEALRLWVGNEKLVLAKHFFWNSGSKIQKSHIGLMQDLLCQILRQCPELMPFASTQRWEANEKYMIHKNAWTRKELTASLESILARGQLTS
jgi:hypothetical protein